MLDKFIKNREIFITQESPDALIGVGNGKPSEELFKILQENAAEFSISQSSRLITHVNIPRYSYEHIQEEFTCPTCTRTYYTDDIETDYDESKIYICPVCKHILDIEIEYEQILNDREFDFEIPKV